MIKIYGIKNCGSVKKALLFFKENKLEYSLFDFKKEKVPCENISSWLDKTDMKTLFNSKSTTYRTLKLKELNLNDDAKKEWLCKENMLIKRPIIEYDDELLVGYNEEKFRGVFL